MNDLIARITSVVEVARRYLGALSLVRKFPAKEWRQHSVLIMCVACDYRQALPASSLNPEQCLVELRDETRCPHCGGKVEIQGLDAHIADLTFSA